MANKLGKGLAAIGLLTALTACGFSEITFYAGTPSPTVTIETPTTASTFTTTATDIRIGGTISGASFLHLGNQETGATNEGYVNYFDGHGTWFADMYGLQLGQNTLVATADYDGTRTFTATAILVVTRVP